MSTHEIEAVEVDRTSHVSVTFADGVTARYELAELRLACPCADCNRKRQQGASVQPAVERGDVVTITTAEFTGAFGLSLDWSDGHSTGIYAFSYLRDHLDRGNLGTTT